MILVSKSYRFQVKEVDKFFKTPLTSSSFHPVFQQMVVEQTGCLVLETQQEQDRRGPGLGAHSLGGERTK